MLIPTALNQVLGVDSIPEDKPVHVAAYQPPLLGHVDTSIFKSGSYNIDVVTAPNLPHTLIPIAPRVYSGVPSGFLCVFRRV